MDPSKMLPFSWKPRDQEIQFYSSDKLPNILGNLETKKEMLERKKGEKNQNEKKHGHWATNEELFRYLYYPQTLRYN